MSTGFAPRNRIRAYTRWPLNREERIATAKTEISAAMFCQRFASFVPHDIVRRANDAFDVLEMEQVPMVEWE